eukprot:snap_masked-scaffold_21-processed-gene-5.68-mRNA-1 protein AED:1.00 eAED:1.00 QI:0/-1/0/0/-1/1/1/0/76
MKTVFTKPLAVRIGKTLFLKLFIHIFLSKDDVEGADESYEYSIPRSYFSIFKDGNLFFLSPEVSSMSTIKSISKEQ